MKRFLALFICVILIAAFGGCADHSHQHSTADEAHNHSHDYTSPTDGTGSIHEHSADEYTQHDVSYSVDVYNPNRAVYSDVCGSHIRDYGELGSADIIAEVEVHGEKWGKLESGDGWIKLEDEIFPEMLMVFADGFDDWGAQLILNSDGSFSGQYWDADMDAVAEAYPNGTQYVSDFTGKLTDAKIKDEYTLSVMMTDLEIGGKISEENIVDGKRLITAEPIGVDNDTEFYLFIPGTPKDKLPEDVLKWWGKRGAEIVGTLPQYCLYNTDTGESFFGNVQ